jgi:hypothetical protein
MPVTPESIWKPGIQQQNIHSLPLIPPAPTLVESQAGKLLYPLLPRVVNQNIFFVIYR